MIEIGERPRGISLRGELQLQLAVSTEAKPDSSSLNKLKCQLKVKKISKNSFILDDSNNNTFKKVMSYQ